MEHIGRQFAMAMAKTQNPDADFWTVRSAVNGYYIGSRVDRDLAVETVLAENIKSENIVRAANSSDQLKRLEQRFSGWIQSHGTNTIVGLEEYDPDYSEGSTPLIVFTLDTGTDVFVALWVNIFIILKLGSAMMRIGVSSLSRIRCCPAML